MNSFDLIADWAGTAHLLLDQVIRNRIQKAVRA
jgi:hypothetical protein